MRFKFWLLGLLSVTTLSVAACAIEQPRAIDNSQVLRTRTDCNKGNYSHQRSQTTVSSGGVSRTYSSSSTTCE
ncbi:MAG: hypothetical protein CLLPBCKN_007929 [Chroococcidiopsis cubana SAG 39.79]|uniref:hypothetical protein n=1 Tax=Chroococcidiopsis TaxID=54298 RepID=UPI0002E8C33B|nr:MULTISPECIES: hypothetical protein [Chroococcidiopsis]MDZ4878494.1 hypothetical protein [Chroococcidiopsis cubana SAG 39.79]PSB63650.1 hypothetical protein C7B79_13040 [Chroococcidiopsis cubana CCALA 043]